MIDLVAQQVVGKKSYAPFYGSVEEQANSLISTYNICLSLRSMNTQGTFTTISEVYALNYSRIQHILSDPTQSALLTDKCVELLLMNSLQEIL